MKKLISILIIICCLFGNISLVFADSIDVIVDDKQAKSGETVVVDVNFENNSGILAAIFKLTYDQERLELLSTEDKHLLQGATFSKNCEAYPYTMVWNSASDSNFTQNGTLVTLTFKVLDTAPSGKAFINLDYNEDDCFDVNLENVELTIKNGGITVEGNEKTSVASSGRSHSGGSVPLVNPVKKDEAMPQNDISNQIIFTINKYETTVFGETKTNDVAPKIVNDRTMLPIRFIAEALGAKVDWNGEKQLVTISNEGLKIEITINKAVALVNGKEVKLDSPAFIENDRTYLPLRFVAENLGAEVEWIEKTQQVVITKAIPEKTTTK